MTDTQDQVLQLLEEQAMIRLRHLEELDKLIEQLQNTEKKAIAKFSGDKAPDLSK